MPKQIIIAEQYRLAAVFSEEQIQELIVAQGNHQVGDIYLGVVENVLPSIDAAFVNIGNGDRNGFIHVTDLGPVRLRRSSASITELVTPQQKVLVQVMKEPTGNKGPRLTGNVTLPGRFLVLMPYGKGVNLSRRIRDEEQRHRLRALAILIKPEGMGLLVRTEAEGVDEQSIIDDLEALKQQWEKIQQKMLTAQAPAMLNRDEDFIQRILRDTYSNQVNRIVVDSAFGQKRVKQHLLSWNSGRMPQGLYVEHHRERVAILEFYRINAAIREALKPRVDLPSGGYVVIQPTEALTVIDVNSGSFTRSATARETVLWTNCEAATEIARQLRLRNIAGVIIVDFIDMESRRDQLQVLEHFSKALKSDKSHPQIAQLTELGLVELTRKRQGQSIYEVFGHSCPTCDGLGLLVNLPGIAPHRDALDPVAALGEYPLSASADDNEYGLGGESEFSDEPKEADLMMPHPTFRNDRRPSRAPAPNRTPIRERSERIERTPERSTDRTVDRTSPTADRNKRRNPRGSRLPRTEVIPAPQPALPTVIPAQTPPPSFLSPLEQVPLIPVPISPPVIIAPVVAPPVIAPPVVAPPVVASPVEVQAPEPEEIERLVPPLVAPPPPLIPREPVLATSRETMILSVSPPPTVVEEPPPNRRRRRSKKEESEPTADTPEEG